MASPSVAICTPSLDLVPAEFAGSLARLARHTQLPIDMFGAIGSLLPRARDNCLEAVANAEQPGRRFDFVFFVDSDVIVPADAIMRLVAHDKDVVGATYVHRGRLTHSAAAGSTKLAGTAAGQFMIESLDGKDIQAAGGVLEVAMIPTGCMLIRRSIFEKMKKPYFRMGVDEQMGRIVGEDHMFCRTVRDLGYRVWVDVDLTKQVAHLGRVVYLA